MDDYPAFWPNFGLFGTGLDRIWFHFQPFRAASKYTFTILGATTPFTVRAFLGSFAPQRVQKYIRAWTRSRNNNRGSQKGKQSKIV